MIVYGLLDQTQPVQYIRIQKAFLGPDNALTMAQQYDSINYINQLQVTVEGLFNGAVVQTFSTANGLIYPDTITTKVPGIFAGPKQVLYAFNTPTGALNSSYVYKLTVRNLATNNTVTATTNLVETSANAVFNIVSPSTALTSVSFEPTTYQTEFDYKWNPAPSGRTYQPSLRFYYTEYYVNGDTAQKSTGEFDLQTVTTTDETATEQLDIKFDKMSFYHFIADQIPVDNNVVSRKARYVEFIVYAGNEQLKDYIEINAPTTSISQDHPLYTNIQNGYGVFAARSRTLNPTTGGTYTFPLGQTSINGNAATGFKGLANGPYTCQLNFQETDGTVPGCQ